MTKRKPGAKVGRPRVPIDYKVVERLASRQCSNREIAAIIGVTERAVRDRLDKDPEFVAAIEKGKESGKGALRSKQYEVAMAGNPTMLIWLGKNCLDQRDHARTEVTGKDGGPVQFESVSDVLAKARAARAKREGK